MKSPLFFLCACLLASSCAGASARYGCPAPSGVSCESVSRVHAGVVSGRGRAEAEAARAAEGKRARKGPPRRRGAFPSAVPLPRGERERETSPGVSAPAAGEPVYVAPRAVRVWMAPWRDSDGMFHSAKYVYALPERGTWKIGGREAAGEDPPGRGRGTLRLRGAEGRR